MLYFFIKMVPATIMLIVSVRVKHNKIIAITATIAIFYLTGLVSYFDLEQVKESESLSMSAYIAAIIFMTSACCWVSLDLYGDILKLKSWRNQDQQISVVLNTDQAAAIVKAHDVGISNLTKEEVGLVEQAISRIKDSIR